MLEKLNIIDWSGNIVNTIDTPDVLKKEFNKILIQEVFHHFSNVRRYSIASTLSRSEVSFSGRKVRPQKRSGNARMGARGMPHHYKGGVCFGPNGRLYNNSKMPKKKVRNALFSLLSKKFELGELKILNNLTLETIHTKSLFKKIKDLNCNNNKLLFIDNKENSNLILSLRNIMNVDFLPNIAMNVYDLFGNKTIIMSLESMKKLEALYES